MAGYKNKTVKQKENPRGRHVSQVENPSKYYSQHPSWNFNTCDPKMWAFAEDNIGDIFWPEIFPFFKSIETQTWQELFLNAKKQHHSIDATRLNKGAQDRLAELFIEQDSIISLRLQGTHRLYGYIIGGTFNIVWFDLNHGDNDTCVCRSYKKHT